MALKSSTLLLISALLFSGCAHHAVNAPLRAVDVGSAYRFQNAAPQTNSDDLLLMLVFPAEVPAPQLSRIACCRNSRKPKWGQMVTSIVCWMM